jgi:putative Mg2+ transporter-C (MgtC) family protein
MDDISHLEQLERLALALLAGAALGFERERRDKPAGLRTYALVCEGAALFMLGSLLLGGIVRDAGGVGYDPSRIGSTIVQGIGFLAGGVILARGTHVVNLTTAAGIWVTAAIGLLIGAGFYFLALAATAATILVLVPLKWVEDRISPTTHDQQSPPGDTPPDEPPANKNVPKQ